MSQEIQFYTTDLFSDRFLSEFDGETDPFPSTNIYQCLKVLFQGTETKSKEYVEKYFYNVELDYLSIYSSNLEKVNQNFNKELQYIFNPKTNTFSFVDGKLWSNLEKIILEQTKDNLSKDDNGKSLKNNVKIAQDYKKLSDVFQKRMLFMAIF
ncbi:MAG: hypothetical protein ACXITR_02885 [Cyanobacterium sp.]